MRIRWLSASDVEGVAPDEGEVLVVLDDHAPIAVIFHPTDALAVFSREPLVASMVPIGLRMTEAGGELHRLSESGIAVEDFDPSLLHSAPAPYRDR